MNQMEKTEKKPNIFLRILDNADAVVAAIIMAAIFIDVVLQVLTRILPVNAFSWTGELGEILLGGLIWIGLSPAVKTNGHIGFDLFVSRLTPRWKKIFGILNLNLFSVCLALLGYLTWGLMQSYIRFKYKMPILGLSMWWVRLPILIGCILGIVRIIIKEYRVITDRERMYERSVSLE